MEIKRGKIFLLGLILFLAIIFSFSFVNAQESSLEVGEEESLEAVVVKIIEEKTIVPPGGGKEQLYQKLLLRVEKGSLRGQEIVVENGGEALVNVSRYRLGDRLIVSRNKDFSGHDVFYISDYVRRRSLFILFAIFIVLTIFSARWQGVSSLLGMAFSFFVIFILVLPRILSGDDPVWAAMVGSFFIVPITFYLAHGVNKKTTTAILSTFISLLVVGFLARIFIDLSRLSGFASEEVGFLKLGARETINVRGLLLAGIIIGALGVLDDVTISQAAVVDQLSKTKEKMGAKELYRRAMAVGRDHIASMVNTLVLAYTGAALPLLLLFVNNPHPFGEVINYEIVAEEIIRTLVGSIGLVLAVPLTTLLAIELQGRKK